MQIRLSTQFYFVLLLSALIFTSCKSRKILTDASDSKNKPVSGNLMEKYSTVLGVSKKQLKNERLYRFIDSWMGVPHRSGGMSKSGVDCSGFTTLLVKEVYNRPVPRIARQMAEQVKRKFEDELSEGDLVFFDFDGQKFSHVGVYLQNNKFVHASSSRGVIISDLKDPWYYKYFSRGGSVRP
jgi:cell wall-associated NlpC family hydrolase